MSEYRTFFGDGEKVFAFPSRELIEELEHKTGQGIGALFRRFRQSDYSFSDVTEIIRLGLVGGGTDPKEADRLVSVYAIGRPLAEVFAVADGVITTLFFGTETASDETTDAARTGDLAQAINDALQQVPA
jgi:hypothetical protein